MAIARIGLVDCQHAPLIASLQALGYEIVHVADLDGLGHLDPVVDITILREETVDLAALDSMERLYFLSESVPALVFITNAAQVDDSIARLITSGTLEPLYESEIASKFYAGRIDRMLLDSRINDRLGQMQRAQADNERLTGEVKLRTDIIQNERELIGDVFSSISAGIILLDTNGTVIKINDHATALLNLPCSTLTGFEYTSLSPEGVVALCTTMLSVAPDASTRPELKSIRCIVNTRTLEVAGVFMSAVHGMSRGVFLFIHDVTEREALTSQLYQSERLATVGTMLSGVTHELRNPLSIISARATLALKKIGDDNASLAKVFESINQQAERCGIIVNNLLDFARKQTFSAASYKLVDIIDETLENCRYQTDYSTVTILKNISDDLFVYGDRHRYIQVFVNLMINAFDAMPGGGILTINAQSSGKRKICIEVHDTGNGIPPESAKQIFDPFFTTKEAGKGTGLGLSIVYKIVTDSGGSCSVISKPKSTSFFILLPRFKENTNA